jgi:hypothetical protein
MLTVLRLLLYAFTESGTVIEFLPPTHLEHQYHALGITAPDMPVPVAMLSMLWQLVRISSSL